MNFVKQEILLGNGGNEINIIKVQKTNRYYLSKNGVRFRKCTYKPDKETREPKISTTEYEADKRVKIFNKFYNVPFEEYDIDYDYYVDECEKIIFVIDGTAERLETERKILVEQKKRDKEEENYIKFIISKIPTQLQYATYNRPWLQEKYGIPNEIKPSKTKPS
jgi:hypothetical protein